MTKLFLKILFRFESAPDNFDENEEFEPNDELILLKSEENDFEILQEPILLSDSEDLGNASLGIPLLNF